MLTLFFAAVLSDAFAAFDADLDFEVGFAEDFVVLFDVVFATDFPALLAALLSFLGCLCPFLLSLCSLHSRRISFLPPHGNQLP